MILDLARFLALERPYWEELEGMLARIEADPGAARTTAELARFHFLYQRASADLVKVGTFASEPEIVGFLESLVARAYGEIHETRRRGKRPALRRLLLAEFPRTVRRHARALGLAVALTLVGALFGAGAVAFDPSSKEALMPFAHLLGDPAERVAQEERGEVDRLSGARARFSAMLMTHNIRVSLFCFALGFTLGLGTAVLLFYNGVILGAVALDYLRAGQGRFLAAWLLPHGSVEIPAILLAGQAGFVLARALAGWGNHLGLRRRMREIAPDLTTLVAGLAALLVWAGIVESFLSQYHEPVFPYELKIAFGLVQLAALALFLGRAGRKERPA